MKRLLGLPWIVASIVCCLFVLQSEARADTVSIRPGPSGELQIKTSWGDFAAYDEGGGVYWVGTQRQFNRARAISISRGLGFRLSSVSTDSKAFAEFVETGSHRATVGNVAIDEIVPRIEFDGKVVGRGAASRQQVSVLWIQNSKVLVTCVIVNARSHGVIGSAEAEDVADEWRSMVFALPKSWLTQPVNLVFLARGRPPGIVHLASFARAEFAYLQPRIRELQLPKDYRDKAKLLKLDPGINRRENPVPEDEFNIPAVQSRPTRQPAEPAPPGAFLGVGSEKQRPTKLVPFNVKTPSGVLTLEVADDVASISVGLSGRPRLQPHTGMLFVFGWEQSLTMWMKNVSYALDFVFVGSSGTVNAVYQLDGVQPGMPESNIPRITGKGKYVLAIPAGEARSAGFTFGARVEELAP